MRCIFLFGGRHFEGRCPNESTTDDPYPLCDEHAEAYGEKQGDQKIVWPGSGQ